VGTGCGEPVEVPLADQVLNLVVKIDAIFGVMVMITMKMTILGLVPLNGRRS